MLMSTHGLAQHLVDHHDVDEMEPPDPGGFRGTSNRVRVEANMRTPFILALSPNRVGKRLGVAEVGAESGRAQLRIRSGFLPSDALPFPVAHQRRTSMGHRDSTRLLLGALLLVAASAAEAGGWALTHQGDPISGKQSTAAILALPGSPATGIVIECDTKTKHVSSVLSFGTYLGDKMIRVEYRVDQQPAAKGSWLATVQGGGVSDYGREFVQGLVGGTTLYFRAYDYRGADTMLTIPLGGSQVPLEEVLADCSQPPELTGVDEGTIDEVAKWGPHVTVLNKTILARLGFFRDAIDATHPASLTVAADQYHKKLHEICAAKNPSNPIACTNMPILIEISVAGTKAEQKEAGPFRISD
jgi:hypothetical protein